MNRKPRILTVLREGLLTSRRVSRAGYTLVELLTSMAILGVMLGVLFSVFDNVQKAWLTGENRVETFTQARAILDLMSRELSQAIATSNITFYGDAMHIYFVAPLSGDPANQADLCEAGYEFHRDDPLGSGNWAFRIRRRLIQPTLSNISGNWNPYALQWYNTFLNQPVPQNFETTTPLATNSIVNFTFQYLQANGNPYLASPYRSDQNNFKLPYAIVIAMDVVDSRTVTKMKAVPVPSFVNQTWQNITNSTLRTFSTTVYPANVTYPP